MVSAAIARRRTQARAAKAHWKRERIARMLAQIAGGRERNAAIAEARALGARLQEIGSAVRLTRERIRQICKEESQTIHVRERPFRQPTWTPAGEQRGQDARARAHQGSRRKVGLLDAQ